MAVRRLVQFLGSMCVSCCCVTPALAGLQVARLFSDYAVLQRDQPLKIWGTTDQSEPVQVQLDDLPPVTAEPQSGHWQTTLPPQAAGGPHRLRVTQGSSTIELKELLFGDVWLCCGQSNMEWPLNQLKVGADYIAKANHDDLRLFQVPRGGAPEPQTEVDSHWTRCTSETAASFSSVGYFFAREIQKHQHVPIGLISSNVGGTPAQRWTRKATLASRPALAKLAKHNEAGDLYNHMINPLVPYGIRGAIWYQGEANGSAGYQYRTLLPTMIADWREVFGQGDFPFLIVQLAPFDAGKENHQATAWAELREAQLFTTQTVRNTALAVITDCGDEHDIHPQRKEPVGQRLATCARALSYGEAIEYQGPTYNKLQVRGSTAVLTFAHTAGGLAAQGGELTGFEIAGVDRAFHPAQAKIEGDTVRVESSDVPEPVAVRYGWTNCPVVNLFNKAGLPASPFRTDTWTLESEK